MKGNTTRQQAINAFCKSCNYDEYDKGNWRQQVASCTMRDCALYAYRPISTPKKPKLTNNGCTDSQEV